MCEFRSCTASDEIVCCLYSDIAGEKHFPENVSWRVDEDDRDWWHERQDMAIERSSSYSCASVRSGRHLVAERYEKAQNADASIHPSYISALQESITTRANRESMLLFFSRWSAEIDCERFGQKSEKNNTAYAIDVLPTWYVAEEVKLFKPPFKFIHSTVISNAVHVLRCGIVVPPL